MKKNSNEWARLFDEHFHIADRSGWGKNTHYSWFEEKIDVGEFVIRCMASTLYMKKDWFNIQNFIQQIKEGNEC